jgi:hypothetical protein
VRSRIRQAAAHFQADALTGAGILAVLAAAYWSTLARGPTWANQATDSGEFITAATTLGVAHPTGYPTYLLLARLFQMLPVGDLALRSHLLSAAAALGAALCVYVCVRMLSRGQHWYALAAAALAALWFGLCPALWAQAVVAEVYTLNALFVGLMLLWLARLAGPEAASQATTHPSWPLVAGLALGNHITVALPIAAALALLLWQSTGQHWRVLARQCAWIGAGLLVYLYVPLRAAAQPPVNWGGASTLAGFWWLISGQPYRELAFGLPPDFLGLRLQAWAALLVQQFGLLGLVLGFLGLLYGAPAHRRFLGISAALVLAYSLFAITYDTADSFAYLLPVYLIFAIWLGAGITHLLAAIAGAAQESGRQWTRLLAPLCAAALLLLVGWSALATAPRVDASQDQRASRFAAEVLAAAPARALVVTSTDRDTFPLWYYHFAQGERPDIAIVVGPLLQFDWYRANLRAVYPALRVPETPVGEHVAALAAANPARPLCRTAPDATSPLVCAPP